MISANLGLALILGLAATGLDDHKNPRPGRCDDCGVETGSVLRRIQVLQGSPREEAREDAAEDLRKLDWRCHPGAVLALSEALIRDPSHDVREEAAESLGRMAPCVPAAHEALSRAAAVDPDRGVRKEARKALGSMGRGCMAACRACGPASAGSVFPAPPIIPDDWMPFLAPGKGPTQARLTIPDQDPGPRLEPLPPALPDLTSPIETVPPPPTPVPLEGPIGSRVLPSERTPTRVR
jgi:hypothetical protein